MSTALALPPAPTNLAIPAPRHHAPSGRPSWPRMLISGEEGARKSWTLAALSADQRLGGMFWMEIGTGEVTAEEYGRIPGVNYQVIEHDGTFTDILGQLWAHWQLAKAAEIAGEPPIALAIDSFTGLWSMLCNWVDLLARRRVADRAEKSKRPVRADLWSADYVPQITPDLWNLANRRHEMVLEVVQTWPGPVGYTAREKLITPFKDNGQPDEKAEKVWTLEAQKGLGFNSSVWLRMTRDTKAAVVKMRSASPTVIKVIQDAGDAPAPWNDGDLNLPKVIFDYIGCEAGVSRAPDHKTLNADQVLPGEVIEPEPDDGANGAANRAMNPPANRGANGARPRRDRAANEKLAAELAVKALALATPEDVADAIAKTRGDSVASFNCSGAIVGDERTKLGLNKGERVTVLGLLERVHVHVGKYGISVADAVREDRAQEDGDAPPLPPEPHEHMDGPDDVPNE